MTTKRNNKRISETIKVWNVNDFPVIEEAKYFINAIKCGVEKPSLFLTDCFRSSTVEMHEALVIVDVFILNKNYYE